MARMAVMVVLSSAALLLVCSTVAIGLLSRILLPRIAALEPDVRVRLLFRLRIFPMAAATIGAVGVVLPTFLWFEPSGSQERIPLTLIATATCGLLLLSSAAWRALRALARTRALARHWLSRARAIDGVETPVAAYAIDDVYPTVAVVGIRRPRLFLSSRVLDECSADETRAMILHEQAHIETHDNARRLALRACPELFASVTNLDRAWEAAAEEAADGLVARRAPHLAMSLAQALVRVGRLVPDPLVASASALYSGGSLESRVRRLVTPAPAAQPSTSYGCVVMTLVTLGAVSVFLLSAPVLHRVIEAIVATLP
jgi:Zn-dependent protease with chaperone function